jgi:hypothetical protein
MLLEALDSTEAIEIYGERLNDIKKSVNGVMEGKINWDACQDSFSGEVKPMRLGRGKKERMVVIPGAIWSTINRILKDEQSED